MLKYNKFFKKKQTKKDNFTKPDLHTHRKSPLESFKSIKLAEEALKETKNMIDEFSSRVSGSFSCLNCADFIDKRLKEYCDFSSIQEYKHKGKAYVLWLTFVPFVYGFSLLLLLIGFSVIPLLINIGFIYYVYREFIILKPIFEKNIKDSEAKNVHGVIEPEDEVLNTIIFTAHHDSAPLLNINRGEKGYFMNVEVPFILYFLSLLINIVEVFVEIITNNLLKIGFPPLTSFIIIALLLLFSPIVFKLRSYYSQDGSPGAGDNLISTSILIQLSRYYSWAKKNNKGLKNTRIIFASFDAEEVGLRGSKIWFEKHQALLKNAFQLNFDCIYNSSDLVFVDSDVNGLKNLSKEITQKCVELANDMGYKVKKHPLPFLSGATDAASGMDIGIKACTLMAINLDDGIKHTYFHTREDTVDKIEKGAVEKAIAIAIKLSKNVDNDDFYWEKTENNRVKENNDKDIKDLIKFNKISRR